MAQFAACSRFVVEKVNGDDEIYMPGPNGPETGLSLDFSAVSCDTDIRSSCKPNGDIQNVKFDEKEEEKTSEKHDNCRDSPRFTFTNTSNRRHQHTYDTLPHADHYRNVLSHVFSSSKRSRPTLEQLHEETTELTLSKESPKKQSPSHLTSKKTIKFGWIKGVLVRCLLNIWGVMLFLRLSWVVGQAGIGLSCVVILLATVVTTVTALSMSAICTNGEVKGGGAYYMISRSLGPEWGGAIGIIFSVANAVAVAMYVVGFAETVRDVMSEHGCKIVDEINDVRIIGSITVVLLLCIAIIGMEWEARAQVVLLIILLVAMLDFVVGTFLPVTAKKGAQGFTGYNGSTFVANFPPDFRGSEDFFSVFAIFFPAATGILAGANISGDLENAQTAIPKGTTLAIFISTLSYLMMACMAGSTVIRDASGNVRDYFLQAANFTCTNSTEQCDYGLINNVHVMKMVSGFAPLILAGIFAATLSSALASLVGAPKVFQAVCKDKVFPGIHVFGVGSKKNDEPHRAYLLTFFIALCFILIGKLNSIAPIISNFFLMAYTLINYSCFDASFANSPGFRPAFRFYSMWLSLLGSLICLAVMFVINWWTALITFCIVAALYVYIHHSKPDVNWGSSTQAHVYRSTLTNIIKLNKVEDHVKNYRPQCLVLSGDPRSRPALVDFVGSFTKNISLMMCGHVVQNGKKVTDTNEVYSYLEKRKVKAFYAGLSSYSVHQGSLSLMQSVGIGKLRPNVVILGYKHNWQMDRPVNVSNYFNIIHDAFDLKLAMGILYVKGGLDCDELGQDEFFQLPTVDSESDPDEIFHSCASLNEFSEQSSTVPSEGVTPTTAGGNFSIEVEKHGESIKHKVVRLYGDDKHKLQAVNQFHRKQKKGFIDVWWLFDDGGLTLLIPYLISQSVEWSSCKLRVFFLKGKEELDNEQRNMATLLNKFRIDYSDMTVIPDHGEEPNEKSIKEFQTLISNWRVKGSKDQDIKQHGVTDSELIALKSKTWRHIRLRELLEQHSKNSNLIVITLPVPRKNTCSVYLYMCWLHLLTHDMPPVLLLRGNQQSVLTFYS